MRLGDITTELQTQCHLGDSNCQTVIRVRDAIYKIKGIKIETIPTKNGHESVYEIEADCD